MHTFNEATQLCKRCCSYTKHNGMHKLTEVEECCSQDCKRKTTASYTLVYTTWIMCAITWGCLTVPIFYYGTTDSVTTNMARSLSAWTVVFCAKITLRLAMTHSQKIRSLKTNKSHINTEPTEIKIKLNLTATLWMDCLINFSNESIY
jgi:hypothetical protein